jgi:hypothetical protein
MRGARTPPADPLAHHDGPHLRRVRAVRALYTLALPETLIGLVLTR